MPDLLAAVKRQGFENAYEYQKLPFVGVIPSVGLCFLVIIYAGFETASGLCFNGDKPFCSPKEDPLEKITYASDNLADLGWIFANNVGNAATLGFLNCFYPNFNCNCINAYQNALNKD